MPATSQKLVSDLHLDLSNFRTIPQPDEDSAIKAMIAVKPDYFWALVDSLLDSGYLPTENIIVLEDGSTPSKLIVKEGNRRIAALKLILGLKPLAGLPIPSELVTRIGLLTPSWKSDNSSVPCAVYPHSDAAIVDQIVTLTHGKSEKAGRDQWQAIARARHNRDVKGGAEPALDLLEKYLVSGRNVTPMQSERWAGDYHITVLAEAMKKLAPRLEAVNAADLASRYPATISHKDEVDEIIHAIGLGNIKFEDLRSTSVDFAARYGIPVVVPTGRGGRSAGAAGSSASSSGSSTSSPSSGSTSSIGTAGGASTIGAGTTTGSATGSSASGSATSDSGASSTPAPVAYSTRDPKAVLRILKQFTPRGANREKVVTLRDEALKLNLNKTPLAFCFLLRSMFEISAKAYCQDNPTVPRLNINRRDGKEKALVDLLKDVTYHLTHDASGTEIMPMARKLHGATTELSKPEGILSVKSMNQLVHSSTYSVTTGDTCTTFGNIYPLLEAMN